MLMPRAGVRFAGLDARVWAHDVRMFDMFGDRRMWMYIHRCEGAMCAYVHMHKYHTHQSQA